ncbi:MAG TPA: OmpA family protein [Bryobacteraceae bacterium]
MHQNPVPLLLAAAALTAAAAAVQAQIAETPSSGLTGRSIQAIGYPVGGGSVTVDLKNTGLIHEADGQARVQARPGVTNVEAEVRGLTPPTDVGAEFLTYVLWAVSPEGRAINLGSVMYGSNGRGKLKATTQLQSFSLFVTAEPYAAVRQPSEMLILENAVRKGTKAKLFPVTEYKLMKRSVYQKLGNPLALSMDLKSIPLEMYEARNAVEIARSRGAEQYAPGIFSKAEGGLKMAENALKRKAGRKEIASLAMVAAQSAEDARAFTVERQEQERIAAEREAAAARARSEAERKAAAEAAEARRQADEEARRQAELASAKQAQIRAEALAREARMQADAEIAASRARAEADALRAREEAAKSEADRARQAAEELRAQLLGQFNRILETRDTPRGLVVTMADVLFDTGRYDLRTETREKLARFSGIVLAHDGLKLEIEGHTDSTGSDAVNQKLSQQRAESVQNYLVQQGLTSDSITATGFGKTMPVAGNETAAGRQRNRRVEIIVSGEVIGVKIGR